MIDLYGIPNCDTVKKARQWLDAQGLAYTFHDFKKEAPSLPQCTDWAQAIGVDTFINRRGTTWRQCSPEQQAAASEVSGAAALAQSTPSVIKRPLVQWPSGQLTVGFKAADWQDLS